MSTQFDREMQQALEADGEKLRQLTGEDHGPFDNIVEADYPTLDEAFDAALLTVKTYYDAASVEETLWTGWGDQTVPFNAEMRRVKVKQALSALLDSDPRRAPQARK